jgi:O-antigen ligase
MKASDSGPRFTPLEQLTLGHVLVLLLGASWVFGGNIWWMRTVLSVWASLGLVITIAAFLQPGDRGQEARSRAWWLLPWALFIVLVVVSAFNPSFRPMTAEGSPVLVNLGARWRALPSSVEPAKALHELWFYSGVYLSAFNLLLVPRSRRLLRLLLVVGATNCLVLAVFGTLQKLIANDLYFGAAHSPNSRFFATFLYNNHWGAFMVLWLATAAGLLFHHATRASGRDLWHSPFTAAALGLLFIATSAPVSASRAATTMAATVMAIVIAHGLLRITASRRAHGRSLVPPIAALLLIVLCTTAAVTWLAQRSIHERYRETQLALEGNQSLLSGRIDLYRDTWELAERKPVFGWGFESFSSAFFLIRPRPLQANRQYESSYAEAHSDWLQSVAETGFVGTALAVLMGLIPLAALTRRAWRHPLVLYPLSGCGLVALYAWIEFPYANGAVLVTFWLLLFTGLRYSCLQRRVGDHGPDLCIPSSS